MAATDESNARTGSTTWEWRRVKMRGPRPEGQAAPKASSRWYGLSRRDAHLRITVTLSYRAGSEAWWLVEARGRQGVFPGHRALHDVMSEINRTW